MDPKEIFELIVKADERLKYATPDKADARKAQARDLLVQALEEARAIGNQQLVQQAETRLADLGMPPVAGGSGEREDAPAVHGSPPPKAKPAPAAGRRPTPLDPYPEPRPPVEGRDEKSYPPELGTDAIAILEGRTFMFSDSLGDVPAGSIGGLLHDDTRFLSSWELTLNGEPLSLLKSRVVDYYSAAFFLTNPEMPGLRANTLTVRRFRFVGNGLHEQVGAYNSSSEPVHFGLRLRVGADFADLFEVKSVVRDRSAKIDVEHDPELSLLHFHYESEGYLAETNVEVRRSGIIRQGLEERLDPSSMMEPELLEERRPAIDGNDLVWDVELDSRTALVFVLRVTVRVNETVLEPMHDEFGEEQQQVEGALTNWLEEVPRFQSDNAVLKNVFDKSILDLAALRIAGELGWPAVIVPEAYGGLGLTYVELAVQIADGAADFLAKELVTALKDVPDAALMKEFHAVNDRAVAEHRGFAEWLRKERLPNAQLSAEAKRFVGFRKLLYTDRYVEKDGKLIKHGERNEARAGSYIIYTPTGHMMVHLMDKAGRMKWAGSTATPQEALATYRSYGGYFGRFTVFETAKPKYVVHNQEGTLNPGRQSDQQRFYELNGNVLRLGGPPTIANGEASGGHLYWELMPPRSTALSSTN